MYIDLTVLLLKWEFRKSQINCRKMGWIDNPRVFSSDGQDFDLGYINLKELLIKLIRRTQESVVSFDISSTWNRRVVFIDVHQITPNIHG